MNLRRSALASLLLISAPLLGGICPTLSEHLGPREALAQDQVTTLAREKFKEGVTAYQQGKFEEARALFLQAYALKRHPAVLLNLGQSELKAGYVEDAGNHLQQFLREHKTATDQQKADAKTGIAEARKRTGQAIMIVDADGADVAIDGKAVGKSPLLDPWFVKPGPHEASAAHQGKTGTSKFTAERGKAVPVSISLGTGGGAVVAPIPTPVPTPAPTTAPPGPQPGIAPAPYPPAGPLGPQPMPTGPGPGASYGGDTGTDGGREDFIDWFVDTPVAWVGAGLTGVGVIGAIVGGAIGGSAASSANSTTDAINAEIANPQSPAGQLDSGQTPCGPEDDPSRDVPHYAQACQQLRDDLSSRDTGYTVMGVFLGVGVLAAAGTVIYYFVDADSEGASTAQMQVIPIISQDTQGLGLVGTF